MDRDDEEGLVGRHVDPDDRSFRRTLLRAALGGLVALALTAAVTGALAQTGAIGDDDGPAVVLETPTVNPPSDEPSDQDVEPSPTGELDVAALTPTAEDATEEITQPPPPGGVAVQVLDGVGDGVRADEAAAVLRDFGYDIVVVQGAARAWDETTVLFSDGHRADAEALVTNDRRFTAVAENTNLDPSVPLHVVVGADWPQG